MGWFKGFRKNSIRTAGDGSPFVEILPVTAISDEATIEFELPSSQEQINVVFDGVPATDSVNLIVELYSGGAWKTTYVEHVAIPGSISVDYAARIDTTANLCYNAGSAIGEVCSVNLKITNHANNLYTLIQVDGGYSDLGGTIRRSNGSIAWKDTAVATKGRLRFSSGNIESGKIGVWGSPCGEFLPLTAGTPVNLNGEASITCSLSDNPLYVISTQSLVPGNDGSQLRITVNSESSGYKYHFGRPKSSSANYDAGATNDIAHLAIGWDLGNDTGENLNIQAIVPNASSAALFKTIFGSGSQVENNSFSRYPTLAGYWSGGTDALTSITLTPSAGNLASGIVRLRQLALFKTAQVGDTFGPWTLKSVSTASGDSEVDFTLGTGIRDIIICVGVIPSANGAWVGGRVGTVVDVKDVDCKRHVNLSDSSSSSYAGASSVSGSLTSYAASAGNDTGENLFQIIEVPNPTGQYKIVSSRGSYVDSDGNAQMANGAGAWTGGTDQLTTYRILPNTGTISGTFYHFSLGE